DWDTHGANFRSLKNTLLPPLDQGLSALLEDLHSRGRLEETLVVWMGDMGRTPRINKDAGRDHWSFWYSVLLAGAGVRGGALCGSRSTRVESIHEPGNLKSVENDSQRRGQKGMVERPAERQIEGHPHHFHVGEKPPLDVDNMSKPIHDVMNKLVYEDDRQIRQA